MLRLAIAAVLTTGLACGRAGENPRVHEADTSAQAPPSPAPGASRGVPGGAVIGLDTGSLIVARIREYDIDLSADSVPAGNADLRVENLGHRVHTIEIRGWAGMRWRTAPIAPGGAVTLRMPLEPGAYLVVSAETAYTERGMRSGFRVQ